MLCFYDVNNDNETILWSHFLHMYTGSGGSVKWNRWKMQANYFVKARMLKFQEAEYLKFEEKKLQVMCGPELHLCARTSQERGRLLPAEFDQGRPGCLCRRGFAESILSASAGLREGDNS